MCVLVQVFERVFVLSNAKANGRSSPNGSSPANENSLSTEQVLGVLRDFRVVPYLMAEKAALKVRGECRVGTLFAWLPRRIVWIDIAHSIVFLCECESDCEQVCFRQEGFAEVQCEGLRDHRLRIGQAVPFGQLQGLHSLCRHDRVLPPSM